MEIIYALSTEKGVSPISRIRKFIFLVKGNFVYISLAVSYSQLKKKKSFLQQPASEGILVVSRFLCRIRAAYFPCMTIVNIPVAQSKFSAMAYFVPLFS